MSRVPIAFFVVLVEIVLLAFIKPRSEEGFFRRTSIMARGGGRLGSSFHQRYAIPADKDVLRVIQRDDRRKDENNNNTETVTTLPERISVVVWNIHKQQSPGFWENFHHLARDRDLILLQELHLKDDDTKDMLLAQNENISSYIMATSFLYENDGSPAGVAIGSRVPPCAVQAQTTTPDVEPVVGTPKASVLAEFPLSNSNSRLLVVSVHGINRASFAAFARQMDALERRLASAQHGPILLAGDFNTQSKRKTRYLMDGLGKRLGLQAVSFANNNNDNAGDDCRTLSKLSRRPLDHVLVRGLSVEHASCRHGGSDHAALMLDLVVLPTTTAEYSTTG